MAKTVDPEQSDLSDLFLHCLPSPLCPKTKDHYGIHTVIRQAIECPYFRQYLTTINEDLEGVQNLANHLKYLAL